MSGFGEAFIGGVLMSAADALRAFDQFNMSTF